MDSPPMRQETGTPRFTEQFNPSPPYQPYSYNSPELAQYDQYFGGHRMSDKAYSPEMMSPGLESVKDEEGHKEVVPSRHPQQQGGLPPGLLGYRRDSDDRRSKRCCGLGGKWCCLLLVVVVVVLGVALGAGLGVGLSKHHSSSKSSSPTSSANNSSEYLIGGAINPAYYTTTGAFNGSGIALASQSFSENVDSGTQGTIVMYFQHHTGQIRWIQLSNNGDWTGGSVSEIVAVDAKNSTPLSAVSYSIAGQNTWHIFYIDQNNVIKQRTNSNTTNVWVDGPINDLNLVANDADSVGMQACWYGSDYGDSDYEHTPLPSQNGPNGNTKFSNQVGMHMWYASNDTTFKQLGWRDGDDSWTAQGEFPNMNGHAGVGCYSWGPGTVTYVMMVNSENTAEFYWKDTNTNLTSTTSHPINQWVKSSVSIPNTNPATSLGYTNYFYLQLDDNTVNGYNISWAAENTTIAANSQFVVGGDAPGVSGTHLSVTALPNQGGGNSILVFYQVEGDDITEYTRDWLAGQWTSAGIPIPNQ